MENFNQRFWWVSIVSISSSLISPPLVKPILAFLAFLFWFINQVSIIQTKFHLDAESAIIMIVRIAGVGVITRGRKAYFPDL